jgi:hypothetical protein
MLVFAVIIVASLALPLRAEAGVSAEIAADLTVGGGTRFGSAPYPVFTYGAQIDVLVGPSDRESPAPRFGPFLTIRGDVNEPHEIASVGGGLSAQVVPGHRSPNPLAASALIASTGAAWVLDTNGATHASSQSVALVTRLFWGFRPHEAFARFSIGLFAEYRWIPAAAGDEHDVVVGLQISPLTLIAAPFIVAGGPSMFGH